MSDRTQKEELTAGGSVTIIPDPSQAETDRYGRRLACVEVDGEDVGAALLEAGLAEVYRAAPNIARYAASVVGSAGSRTSLRGRFMKLLRSD